MYERPLHEEKDMYTPESVKDDAMAVGYGLAWVFHTIAKLVNRRKER